MSKHNPHRAYPEDVAAKATYLLSLAKMMAYVIKHGPQLIDQLAKELQAYIDELVNEDYAKEFENAMDAVASQRIQLLEYISDRQELIEFMKKSEYVREQKKS